MGSVGRKITEESIKKSVAFIANGVGFCSANSNALNLLSFVLAKYMSDLCKCIQSFSEVGSRDKCSIVDVYQGFRHLGFDFADIYKYALEGSWQPSLPESTPSDTLENEEKLFIVDRFPYTYMTESTLPNAPNPPFPSLPPLHTYMHTPAVANSSSHEMPTREDFIDVNSRICESLVRYVSRVIGISSGNDNEAHDPVAPTITKPESDTQEEYDSITFGGVLTPQSAAHDGTTADSPCNMLLNLEVGLFPINYELSFCSNIRRKLP